jgi:predicted GH43/DUF377 family glycosyl hydrolase
MRLSRVSDEPILSPRPDVSWEKDAVFNTAAVHHDGVFHLFYRAVAHRPGAPNRSCIGHAWSRDGVRFDRADEPALAYGPPEEVGNPFETQGVEDPRVTRLEGTFWMLYTAYDGATPQVACATSDDLERWERRGLIVPAELFGCANKDAALFPERIGGRYAVIHRPEPDMCLSFSDDLRSWTDHARFMTPREGVAWEEKKIGLSGPPMRTDAGWLVVYHGVDEGHVYRQGLALLDLADPVRVLKRTDEPVLEPELPWELRGDVPNVVFSCGNLLFGTELWLYYGGADTVIGLAKGDVSEFLGG